MRAVVLALLVASAPAFGDVTAPTAAKGQAQRRHVMTAAEARQCALPSTGEGAFFTPAARDVQRVDDTLQAALAAIVEAHKDPTAKRVLQRLGTDVRWYFGAVEKGRRVIEIRGFCAQIAEGADGCYPLVKDGGDCIWYLRFDLARGTFDGFATNGSA